MYWGGAGGLEARLTIEDHRQWDGKSSLSGAAKKSRTPTSSTALTDLKLI